MEIKVSVPGIEKLLDYAASGIGSVAGPMLASWRARQEAKAKAIAARGEVESQKILTEGDATTMGMIAAAQADARSILVSPDSTVRGELEFAEAITQRIQFQEEKRQSNIGQVMTQTALELEGKAVEDHEPDHDWTARFFNDVQDVSTKEAQLLYANILAGEVERPGSTSVRTLSILRDLDRSTAILFKTLSSASISLFHDAQHIVDTRVLSFGGDATQNALEEFGLSFDNLNILNEHGLIIGDYKSRYDIRVCISTFGENEKHEKLVVRVPFGFQGRYWVLVPTSERELGAEYRVSGVAMTKAGRELSRVVACHPMPDYHQKLRDFLASQGFEMIESVDSSPQVVAAHTR